MYALSCLFFTDAENKTLFKLNMKKHCLEKEKRTIKFFFSQEEYPSNEQNRNEMVTHECSK